MALKPLTYYKWHWQDWRANRHVQKMSYIEKGLYRELLDECWVEGSIPSSIEELADICHCPLEVMEDAWRKIGKCFIEVDGRFINERLNRERTEKDAIRVHLAENGRKGGEAKLLKEKELEEASKQMLSKCQANAKQMPYRREEKRREENNTLTSPDDDDTQSDSVGENNQDIEPESHPQQKIDYHGIVDLYNKILPELPACRIITDKRRSAMRTCVNTKKSYSELNFWESYFKAVKESDFLMGRAKNWKADFDFLIRHSAFVKIIEGGYK